MTKILVVDDEKHIGELVSYALQKEGYQVLTAQDGNRALELVQSEQPALVVLDIMLPGVDGLTICRLMRQNERTRDIPVIMLSARGQEIDRVLGLELGADDYITKPFSVRELVARVKARLRRSRGGPVRRRPLRIGELVVDPDRLTVEAGGGQEQLTRTEFELLWFLAANPGRVFTRDVLLEQVWGFDFSGDSRTVDVHIRHIRQKLERLPGSPRDFIETVRGVGYRFREGN
jgi:two-component system alkaline phosphatase synthesis response regulator PhoP